MGINEEFQAVLKFCFLVEYLLQVGFDVESLQDGIQIIKEVIE